MIRTETITFPSRGWLGAKIKSIVVSRIKRTGKPTLRASPEQKQALKEKFKVTEKKRNG